MRDGEKKVVFVEQSRWPTSIDLAWSSRAGVGNSSVFPLDVTAADFVVPRGKALKLTHVMWLLSPFAYTPDDSDVQLQLFINREAQIALRRTQVVAADVLTAFDCGFMQGVWIGVFLRLDEGEILTIRNASSAAIPAGSTLNYKIRGTLATNTGSPRNHEFTNR